MGIPDEGVFVSGMASNMPSPFGSTFTAPGLFRPSFLPLGAKVAFLRVTRLSR